MDSGVEDADGLGSRVEEFPFGERCGVSVEAHHLQKVSAVAIPDERVHCQGDFLGLAELAEAGHASGHVQQDHGGTRGLVFGVVDLEVVVGDPDRGSTTLSGQGISKRAVKVEVRNGVAVLVGTGFFVLGFPGSAGCRVVFAGLYDFAVTGAGAVSASVQIHDLEGSGES